MSKTELVAEFERREKRIAEVQIELREISDALEAGSVEESDRWRFQETCRAALNIIRNQQAELNRTRRGVTV